jgi:hypothetical protein
MVWDTWAWFTGTPWVLCVTFLAVLAGFGLLVWSTGSISSVQADFSPTTVSADTADTTFTEILVAYLVVETTSEPRRRISREPWGLFVGREDFRVFPDAAAPWAMSLTAGDVVTLPPTWGLWQTSEKVSRFGGGLQLAHDFAQGWELRREDVVVYASQD